MISAQVLAIAAFVISWLWWVTFVVGSVALILIQSVWCCRQSKSGLYISAAFSAVAGLSSFISGIVIYFVWRGKSSCAVFGLTQFDDDYNYNGNEMSARVSDTNGDTISYESGGKADECNEWVFVQVALVETLLWLATSICIIHFVKSKRFKKQEERLCQEHGLTPLTPVSAENFNWVFNRNDDDDTPEEEEPECEKEQVDADAEDDDNNDDVIAVPDNDVPIAAVPTSPVPSTVFKLTNKSDIETGPVLEIDTPIMKPSSDEKDNIETYSTTNNDDGNTNLPMTYSTTNNDDGNNNVPITYSTTFNDDGNNNVPMQPPFGGLDNMSSYSTEC